MWLGIWARCKLCRDLGAQNDASVHLQWVIAYIIVTLISYSMNTLRQDGPSAPTSWRRTSRQKAKMQLYDMPPWRLSVGRQIPKDSDTQFVCLQSPYVRQRRWVGNRCYWQSVSVESQHRAPIRLQWPQHRPLWMRCPASAATVLKSRLDADASYRPARSRM